jgi:proteasome-associated ATPase
LAKEYSKKLGREVKECFLSISGPKILNMWVGETERMVREIFAIARARAKEGQLVFIFMDEAESLLRTRSSGRNFSMSNTVVPQFCAELDGLVELDNVVLMLTSNRPDYIDPAILRPGRIDRKVKVERPSKEACRQILNIYLPATLPFDPELLAESDGDPDCARRTLVELATEEIWRKTPSEEIATMYLRDGNQEVLYRSSFVSGAILESIIDRAKESAIRRSLDNLGEQTGLKTQDIIDAIDKEFLENDILPQSDQVEDWVQLLDMKSDNCVAVRSRRKDKEKLGTKSYGTRRLKSIV